VWAFNGATTGLDPGKFNSTTYNGGSASTITSIQTGAITPSGNAELVIVALNQGRVACDQTMAIASPTFTGSEEIPITFVWPLDVQYLYSAPSTCTSPVYFPMGPGLQNGMAYYLQGTAAAINPTLSWGAGSGYVAAAIAAFK
jgi:hypothetical protein